MRKTLVLLNFILAFFIFIHLSQAQAQDAPGTFTCAGVRQVCGLTENKCNPGYKPDDCFKWVGDPNQCNQTRLCIPEETPQNCTPHAYFPGSSCPSDFPVMCGNKVLCCKTRNDCGIPPAESPQPTQPTPCPGPAGEGIQTALGCIPTKDTAQFVGWLLGSAIKIAGGIAFLLIIFGAIKVLTSSGNPEAVKAGQEMITSALMGLLFIIFSLFLLELIGVKILQIPGFGQ